MLYRHNKDAAFEITTKRLQILTTVQLMQHHSINTTMRNIRTNLANTGIFGDWLNLLKQLTDLINANLLVKTGSKYLLTVEAIYLLSELEKKLVSTRFNR